MRSIRSTRNKSTEERFRSALIEAGIDGWETQPDMKYKPDFIFREQRIAIFLDGCFWHGCPTCPNKKPAANRDYWTAKVARNQKRDREASEYLSREGWDVLRFWEHDIRKDLSASVAIVGNMLSSKIAAANTGRRRKSRSKQQMAINQNPSLSDAKKRLDDIIRKSRTDLYKPIQIAEALYHSRQGFPGIDLSNLESYRTQSGHWRNSVTLRLLGKVSTSSSRYKDNVWDSNAMYPALLVILDEENKRTGGAVEKYVYLRFQEKQNAVSSIISIVESADPQTFDIKSLFDVFEKHRDFRRSIDKVYEIVVYSLMETIVTELQTQITVSVPSSGNPLLSEFADIAKLLFGLSEGLSEYTLAAHVYRAGVTNAADRGLDMWTNFGPTIQVKHITLFPIVAEEITNHIESDNIIIVCEAADQAVIQAVISRIGWARKVRGIVTKTELIDWYERCLKGTYADLLAQKLLNRLSEEFKKEFVRALTITDFLEERQYLTVPSPEPWNIDILQELSADEDDSDE